MILTVVLLAVILLLTGFAVYIAGLISSKLDMVILYLRSDQKQKDEGENEILKKQFMGMMNYTAEDRRGTNE